MDKMNRRKLLQDATKWGLGLTALGAIPDLLDGCGSSAGPTAAGSPLLTFLKTASKPYAGTTLNVLAISSAQAAAAQSVLSEFTSTTGINVHFTSLSENDTITKAQITLSSHSGGFDVLQVESFFIPLYAQNQWLRSVSELRADNKVTYSGLSLSNYAPAAVHQLTGQNTLYALPMFLATQVFYYRTDVFQQHGIQPPTSFDQLQAVCAQIHNKPIPAIAMRSGIGPTENVFDWTAWLYAFGGRYFQSYDAATGKYGPPALNSAEAVAAAQLYASILRQYGPSGSLSWQVSDVVRAFESGQVAMIQEGNPFGGTLNDPAHSRVAGKVGAFAIPTGPKGQFFPSAAQGWAVNRYSEHQQAAWLFAQWATDPATQLKATLASPFSSPPVPSIYTDAKFQKKYQFPGFLSSVHTALEGTVSPDGGPYIPGLIDWNSIGQSVSVQLNKVITGQVTAQAGLTAANQQVQATLQQTGYYSS